MFNATQCPFEDQAAIDDLTGPAALGHIGGSIETLDNRCGAFQRCIGIGHGMQHAGNRCLLDDEAVIAGMEPAEHVADEACLLDEALQIEPRTLLACREAEDHAFNAVIDQIILERALILQILLGFSACDLVKRRLGDEEMTAFDQFRHLAEEEGEQQGSDVGAVDVGVRHDDDFVITQLVAVEFVLADAGAERRDQRADFLRAEHFVKPRTLDIEDFAAQGEHCLIFAVTALLCGSACRVTLDDEDFGLGRITLLAIREFSGQICDIKRSLSPRQFASLARRLACRSRFDDFRHNCSRIGGMLFKPYRQGFAQRAFDDGAHFGRDKLILGLRREFRIRHFHRQNGSQAFARIVTGERNLLFLGDAGCFGIAGHLSSQRATETGKMGSTIALRDVVGEAQHVLVIGIVPPQGRFDRDTVPFRRDIDRIGDQRGFCAVEIAGEFDQSALIHHVLAARLGMAQIGEDDVDARIQERQFAQPVLKRAIVIFDHGEGLLRDFEGHFRAVPAFAGTDFGERGIGNAMGEAHGVLLPVAPDAELEPFRQSVHNRHADAVQPAGNLIGILVEFTAGMQLGHDDFSR